MIEIQYISNLNKKRKARKRQLPSLPNTHINPTYMNTIPKVGKLSFAEINSNKSLENLQGEIWKDIQGLEGYYQISNLGRIKSLYREVPHRRIAGSQVTKEKSKVLSIRKNNSNYMIYSLSKNRQRFHGTIHRAVALAFIPNPENKPCVNHIDCNKTNNKVENLEWCTYKENSAHSIKMGNVKNKGELNGSSKLSNKQVLEIRKKIENGAKGVDIAKEYGIATSSVSRIKKREVYFEI